MKRTTSGSAHIWASGSRSPGRNARRIRRSVSSVGASLINGLFLGQAEAAETLVEARDLAALGHLAGAADPRGVDLRIDVEMERVAFLAPGRANLELGAVGHFDIDHVVVGMDTGLHLIFPWLSRWFPTSGDKLSGASTGRGPKLQLERVAAPLPSSAARNAQRARSRRTAAPCRIDRRQPCSGRTELRPQSRRRGPRASADTCHRPATRQNC